MKRLTAETQRRKLKRSNSTNECCAICGCELNRKGNYGTPTLQGRAHATKHHFVAERFFGRSVNRKGIVRLRLFATCPWGLEGKYEVFCYECHEVLLHNPVLTQANILNFAKLVHELDLDEPNKSKSREKLAGRIKLFQQAIERGIDDLVKQNSLSLRASAVKN